MPSRLVHDVHSVIAFGLPYRHVHAKKDLFSQRAPGIRHREVGHRKYQMFGRTWDFTDPFPANEHQAVKRVLRWKGPAIAEEYMVSLSHDVDDKNWDFDGLSRDERTVLRKYWESFCAWLVLNPDVLKAWAGVDVVSGRVHRVIDGVELWEDEPALIGAYAALYNHVRLLIRRDRVLRDTLVEYGGLDPSALKQGLEPKALHREQSKGATTADHA